MKNVLAPIIAVGRAINIKIESCFKSYFSLLQKYHTVKIAQSIPSIIVKE
jgi:hypothetical protein